MAHVLLEMESSVSRDKHFKSLGFSGIQEFPILISSKSCIARRHRFVMSKMKAQTVWQVLVEKNLQRFHGTS